MNFPPLRLSIREHDRVFDITAASSPAARKLFEPPMMGGAHLKLKEDLYELLTKGAPQRIVSVTGEAGVGKSRVLRETLRAFTGSSFRCATYYFSSATSDKQWRCFLEEVRYPAHAVPAGMADRVSALLRDAAFFSNTILVFEDLHNAPPEVIDVFRMAILENWLGGMRLYLVLTGRNDWSIPNKDYIGLLALLDSMPEEAVFPRSLRPLDRDDAPQLIRAILRDAPPWAVERMDSLSAGNPFNITQIILHLLDRSLASIADRRTVAILQPELLHCQSASDSGLFQILCDQTEVEWVSLNSRY